MFKLPLLQKLTVLMFCSLSIFIIAGCDLMENYTKIDRETDMEFQDYRDAMAPRDVSQVQDDESQAPDLMDFVASNTEKLKPMPLVSIQVNQTVPIKDILFELASQAGYDIELDPRIEGSIIFTARNRPFDLVVARICDAAGLRYKFKDDILRVELDTPYIKNYRVDFVNIQRTTDGEIGSDTKMDIGDDGETGSDFSLESESEFDIWGDIESNLTQILSADMELKSLRTESDPRISAIAQKEQEAKTEGNKAVLKVDSLPVSGEDSNKKDSKKTSNNSKEVGFYGSTFSMNKQAGLITVYGTESQQKEVAQYLESVKKQIGTQVLIEAKVLEVTLSDEYSAGIDWNSIDLFEDHINLGFDPSGTTRAALNPAVDPSVDFVLGYSGSKLDVAISAISRFGTVRALSSPRITVMNNQPAVLNVANNQVYFELDIEVEDDDDDDDSSSWINIDSTAKTVPEGVLINVLPSINSDENTVTMSIRPTITRIVDYVTDPAVAYAIAYSGVDDLDISSTIPVLNMQEMESLINMKSGQTVIMGGLMQDSYESEQNGVPGASELPIFGSLFRNQADSITKKELVVFLKATIIDGSNVHPTDKELYRTFSSDRRPFSM